MRFFKQKNRCDIFLSITSVFYFSALYKIKKVIVYLVGSNSIWILLPLSVESLSVRTIICAFFGSSTVKNERVFCIEILVTQEPSTEEAVAMNLIRLSLFMRSI